jgi:hypothetical protein
LPYDGGEPVSRTRGDDLGQLVDVAQRTVTSRGRGAYGVQRRVSTLSHRCIERGTRVAQPMDFIVGALFVGTRGQSGEIGCLQR